SSPCGCARRSRARRRAPPAAARRTRRVRTSPASTAAWPLARLSSGEGCGLCLQLRAVLEDRPVGIQGRAREQAGADVRVAGRERLGGAAVGGVQDEQAAERVAVRADQRAGLDDAGGAGAQVVEMRRAGRLPYPGRVRAVDADQCEAHEIAETLFLTLRSLPHYVCRP